MMWLRNGVLFRVAGYATGFAALFAIWHIASVYLVGSILFPPPARVIVRAIELIRDGTLGEQVAVILTGMRLGMGNSFVTIVAAELIAANAGLGKMI